MIDNNAIAEKSKQDSKDEIFEELNIEEQLKEYFLLQQKCESVLKKINKRKSKKEKRT